MHNRRIVCLSPSDSMPGSMPRDMVSGLTIALAILCAPGLPGAQTPATDAARTGSQCAVAADEDYAFTREQPVQVGGGAMFVASRERRYMDALRGPGGEPVRYKRLHSAPAPDGQTILDAYELIYDGGEKPATIYLDAYHFDDDMRAPKGFICGAPIGLMPPGPDLFQASRQLARLAVDQGAAKDFAPIPLDAGPDGRPARGVVLDHFRMMARVTRAAASGGTPIVLDPAQRPPDALRQRTVIVAFPWTCDGRRILPRSIDLMSAQGQPAPRQGDDVAGEALAAQVPGLDVPEGSVAATFGLQAPRANDAVRITYAEPCNGAADVTLQLRQTPLRTINTPQPAMPDGVSAASNSVRLQAQVDLDGGLKYVTYVGGSRELLAAAAEAVRGWSVDPVRINNAPISTPVALQVTFRAREQTPLLVLFGNTSGSYSRAACVSRSRDHRTPAVGRRAATLARACMIS
jgi:hypothetical protein